MEKEALIHEFNSLGIKDMEQVIELYPLKGDFINLEYHLPSGQAIKIWEDEQIYYGAELCKKGSHRCYGLVASDCHLLVCEYGDGGKEAEIVILKRL